MKCKWGEIANDFAKQMAKERQKRTGSNWKFSIHLIFCQN